MFLCFHHLLTCRTCAHQSPFCSDASDSKLAGDAMAALQVAREDTISMEQADNLTYF